MRLIRNNSTDEDWEVGGVRYRELIKQPYSNAAFSAGSVKGAEPDILYLRWQRDNEEGGMLLLTPDEVAAIAWVMSGVLWSHEMRRREDESGVD